MGEKLESKKRRCKFKQTGFKINECRPLRQDAEGFPKRLMNWYRRNCRTLPWRLEPTPYRVWISEIMLQQTQVATASPYYVRFLERFPNLESLAKASEKEILTLWTGLGYYSRARNLHKTAREIVQLHRGVFPSEFKTILALPGIGRYTAGAICSLAFNQPQPIVDGNIRRVITRLNGIADRVPESFYWRQMEFWIPKGKASVFNQAMMELGATVCTPFRPLCTRCPVRQFCRACEKRLQNSLPRPRLRKPPLNLEMAILILKRSGRILASREKPDFIPGEWGLPSSLIPGKDCSEEIIGRLIRNWTGSAIRPAYSAQITHSIGRRQIAAQIFTAETVIPFKKTHGRFRWIKRSRAEEFFTSSLFLKALSSAG